MAAGRLVWDKAGEKYYETGVDRGVCYPQAADGSYPMGEAWNGLRQVDASPTGGEETSLYANNTKYASMFSAEDFGGTIGCYTAPDSFLECDGQVMIAPGVWASQQARKPFAFTYRTLKGNDSVGDAFGYTLHLVWGAKVSPTEKSNSTVNDSPSAVELSYAFTTTPTTPTVEMVDKDPLRPMSKLSIDSTKVDKTKLAELEAILYGVDADTEGGITAVQAKMPSVDEVLTMLKTA